MEQATHSIRVKQADKLKIEVNDNGDFIEISVWDKGLQKRLAGFVQKMKELQKDAVAKEQEIKNLTAENYNEDEVIALLQYDAELSEVLAQEIDKVFGVGTSDKVFGVGVLPTLDTVTDFLNQLLPIVQEAMARRKNNINNKYGAHRRGGNAGH